MKNANIREGLDILSAYVSGESYSMAAEHDQIYFGPDDVGNVAAEDATRLKALGWFVDEDAGRWSAYP